MNDKIILRPEGMFIKPIEKWINQEQPLDSNSWLKYLNHEIQLEDGPTLLDLFTFLNKANPEKIEIINMLFGQNIALLLADVSAQTDDTYGISHLEISHFTELFRPTHGEPWFTHDFELHGVYHNQKYTINMVPNNLLANIPIEISNMSKLCIVDWNNKEENSYDFKTRINVCEFLTCIIREISFYGNNEDKIRLSEERSKPRR